MRLWEYLIRKTIRADAEGMKTVAKDFLTTVLCTVLSILTMFAITKIIGYRQMSEMTMFDYVNGITIGSIGAELATSTEKDFIVPLTATVIFGVVTVLLAAATSKSRRFRSAVNGVPLVLLKGCHMYRDNFRAAHMDIDEFLMQCRNQGYFELSQIECAILETNGSLSILPGAAYRPLTPQDMNMAVNGSAAGSSVIMDGRVESEALKKAGYEKSWLEKNLAKLGFSSEKEVFYAYVSDGKLYAYNDKPKKR